METNQFLAGPTSQFLNGTHEFSELVLVRMALLVDQTRSIPCSGRPKRGNLETCGGKNVRARLGPFAWSDLTDGKQP